MIKSYLKIAWRSLLKHKSFSVINIVGLAIGIAACMIIFLHVRYETTYDHYNVHADRIARITSKIRTPESDIALATSPGALVDALKKDFPEVATAVRLESATLGIKLNTEVFKEEGFYKSDPDVFKVFSFDFVEGEGNTALQKPQSIVLTQSVAKKYFGQQPAAGKTLNCNGEDLLVTAVVKDRPANSDLKIDALMHNDFSKTATWGEFDLYTYVLFKQPTDLKIFEKRLAPMVTKNVDPHLNGDGSTGYSAYLEAEPLKAVHYSKDNDDRQPQGERAIKLYFRVAGDIYPGHCGSKLYQPEYGQIQRKSKGSRHP